MYPPTPAGRFEGGYLPFLPVFLTSGEKWVKSSFHVFDAGFKKNSGTSRRTTRGGVPPPVSEVGPPLSSPRLPVQTPLSPPPLRAQLGERDAEVARLRLELDGRPGPDEFARQASALRAGAGAPVPIPASPLPPHLT